MRSVGLVRLKLAFAVSTLPLLAQEPTVPQGQTTQRSRNAEAIDKLSRVTRVNGLVIDDHTGKPLRGARFQLTAMVMHSFCLAIHCPPPQPALKPDPPCEVVTGDDGRFEFDNVAALKSFIRASKPDYADVWPRHANQGGIQPTGDGTGQILLRLMPLASITGVLRNHEGEPIAKVWNVALFSVGNLNGWQRTVPGGWPKYAEDGSYSFHDLHPGRYYLVAEPLRNWSEPPRDAEGHAVSEVPIRYPEATAQDPRPTFTVHEGEQLHIDLRFPEERLYHVTGTGGPESPVSCNIVGANGGIFRPREVTVHHDGSVYLFNGTPVVSGDYETNSFEVWLPNGTYRLSNGGDDEIFGSQPFEVKDSDLSDLSFTIAPIRSTWPKVPIEISSVAPPGTTGPGAGPDCAFVIVNLVRILLNGDGQEGGQLFSGWVGPDCPTPQQPELRTWAPGIYAVEVLAATNLYAKSVTSGAFNLAAGPLVVRPGEPPQPIRVMLAQGAAVDGVVQYHGKPARAWVYAVAEDIETNADFRIFQPAFSEGDGTFSMIGMAPGSYTFFASDIELALNKHNQAATAYWRSHGKIAHVEAGKAINLSLEVVDPPDEP